LSRAFTCADARNTPWVGTEHLMLSALDRSSPCAVLLQQAGVSSSAYTEELELYLCDGRVPGVAEG